MDFWGEQWSQGAMDFFVGAERNMGVVYVSYVTMHIGIIDLVVKHGVGYFSGGKGWRGKEQICGAAAITWLGHFWAKFVNSIIFHLKHLHLLLLSNYNPFTQNQTVLYGRLPDQHVGAIQQIIAYIQ